MMTSRPPQPFHFALVVLTLLALMLLWPGIVPAATTAAAARKAAPDFSLDGPDGTPVKLSSYRGKIVLLDFWATWCHGCKTEIPWYVEFQDKYKSQGLAAIGVSMDDGWKAVKPFLAEHKLNYPIVIGSDSLAKQYAVESLPVTLLIDRRGNIAESHAGLVDKSAFEADIQTLLKEK
jgi:cytochrome c biogenesis protein CcmG/thiol:disulfide interchange protein DsbE